MDRSGTTDLTPDPISPPSDGNEDSGGVPLRTRITRVLVLVVLVGFAAFWTWALFFASKEAVNKIDDRGWAERAEAICVRAEADREALADYRRLDPEDPAMMVERAELIDRSTDVLEAMLDDVVAVEPADDKGRSLVPLWESEYRDYLSSRRDHADVVRGGSNAPFLEPDGGGIPISQRLSVFATDNEMPTCGPPRDL